MQQVDWHTLLKDRTLTSGARLEVSARPFCDFAFMRLCVFNFHDSSITCKVEVRPLNQISVCAYSETGAEKDTHLTATNLQKRCAHVTIIQVYSASWRPVSVEHML